MDISLGERIKEIRKMKGISQEELAHLCDISPGVGAGRSRPYFVGSI